MTRHWFGCFFGHDWEMKFHSGPRLWCDVGYECRRCGARKEVHEDHWTDRHFEKGWRGWK